jgi:glycosyltransferase involved in cell wall biosynthesis
MRVLVLTPYAYGTVPGPRSSFELWERVLRESDIHLDYLVFETAALHEVLYEPGRVPAKAWEMARAYARFAPRAIRRARDYDAVLINREATLVGPAALERLVARSGRPLIYLLDDPLYIPYRSPSNGWLSYLKFFGKVKSLCRMSSVVLANSPSHARFARAYNDNVWEIPSVVDGDLYTGWAPQESPTGAVGIGWTGSPSTASNLKVIADPLEALGRRDDVELRFIGASESELPGVPHTLLPWRASTEVEDLRSFDVGLLPLPRTPWTRHKFYLKLVQYMALGIPPVATPLGSNPILIKEGETGFLADSDGEWLAKLERLVADPALRERVGRRAAELALSRYTLQANAERIVAAFRSTNDLRGAPSG